MTQILDISKHERDGSRGLNQAWNQRFVGSRRIAVCSIRKCQPLQGTLAKTHRGEGLIFEPVVQLR